MVLLNLAILLGVSAGVWFLTGLDKTASGESKRSHHFTRALRCIAVVFLVTVFLWFAEGGGGPGGAVLLMILPISIALVLRSSISELFSQLFLRLADPTLHDSRPLDLGKSQRYQDAIARLIHQGQRDAAIKLCEELKQSGEVDIVTLENTLEFLGVPQPDTKREDPFAKAARLRARGKFAEAEQLLRIQLAKNPADAGSAMMLMRLYAENLRQPDKAQEVLRTLATQPHVPAGHIEFAHRSIAEWSAAQTAAAESPARPETKSVDELLAAGFVGSAMEQLEAQIKWQPHDFDLRLKQAEVQALYCHNFQRAETIIRQMERQFSPEQVDQAWSKLKQWREA